MNTQHVWVSIRHWFYTKRKAVIKLAGNKFHNSGPQSTILSLHWDHNYHNIRFIPSTTSSVTRSGDHLPSQDEKNNISTCQIICFRLKIQSIPKKMPVSSPLIFQLVPVILNDIRSIFFFPYLVQYLALINLKYCWIADCGCRLKLKHTQQNAHEENTHWSDLTISTVKFFPISVKKQNKK